MAFVRAFAAVFLGKLDPVSFDLIHGPNVDTIGADNFHILFDINHFSPIFRRNLPTLIIQQGLGSKP
jgi:hypothetical protein